MALLNVMYTNTGRRVLVRDEARGELEAGPTDIDTKEKERAAARFHARTKRTARRSNGLLSAEKNDWADADWGTAVRTEKRKRAKAWVGFSRGKSA